MRREVKITIPGVRSESPGERDNGKTFIVREMPADQGERWCMRAAELITKATLSADMGGAAQLAHTISSNDLVMMHITSALMDPALDELWNCIEYQHAPNVPSRKVTQGENSDIEEISTRTRLRLEVLKLHTNFLGGAEPPTSAVERAQTSA